MLQGESLSKIWWRRRPFPPTGLAVHGSPGCWRAPGSTATRSGEADAALLGLLVDHATALVEHERLTARVGELQTPPGNAALMLPSHQRVAAAVGILMVLHHLTAAQATDLLTRASQHTHLSIRGVPDIVLRTGAMPDHPDPAAPIVLMANPRWPH